MSWLPLLSKGGACLKCSVGVCLTVLALLPGKHTHPVDLDQLLAIFICQYFILTLNKYMQCNVSAKFGLGKIFPRKPNTWVPWIRGPPTKLAHPVDGFLDLGRLGLVLGHLI